MATELVLNELSLLPEADGRHEARRRMDEFVRMLVEVRRLAGASISLRLPEPLDGVTLASSYRVAQWCNDPEVPRELRTYLRSVLANWPYLRAGEDGEHYDADLGAEFRCEGATARGLGAALLLDAIALSLPSDPRWDRNTISLEVSWLLDDGTLREDIGQVRHACSRHHLPAHQAFLESQAFAAIRDGQDLWARREDLFPSLQFCERVERQLAGLDAGHPLLPQIARRLMQLDRYFRRWSGGPLEPQAITAKISPESQATLAQYLAEHSFVCPDGQIRCFSWHARLTPDAWRLYFDAPAPQRVFVGHIGPKLPSVRYPT